MLRYYYCKNGGTLYYIRSKSCVCPINFKGVRCEIEKQSSLLIQISYNKVIILKLSFFKDLCLSNPCQNSGTCTYNLLHDSYKCSCKKGFGGHKCEIEGFIIF